MWQANDQGFYDVQQPDVQPRTNGRGFFTADDKGEFWFRTIVPSYYPIPTDGPVGELLKATGRHAFRPAHIHFIVAAPGHRPLTTHIFVAGSEYIESDTVFAVKKSLVEDFEEVTDPALAEKWNVGQVPFRHADFDIIMQPGSYKPLRTRDRPAPPRRCSSAARAALTRGYSNSKPASSSRFGSTRALVSSSDDISPRPSLSSGRGDAQPGEVGAPERGVQRRRQLGVGDRVGRGQVVGPAAGVRAGAVEQEADRADLVGERDPAHHLVAVAEAGQHAEAGRERQPAEHAAAGTEDEAAAQVGDADARRRGRARRRPPSRPPPGRGTPCPAGASSVTAAPPVSPYQPIAEATMKVAGRGDEAARAAASARVASTRLDRISAL